MENFMEHTKAKDDNQSEQQRLEGQHEVILHAMGKPIYAPIDLSKPGLRILDSGCANGRWLRDLRSSSAAKHEYVGTDIQPSVFPSDHPSDMSFMAQSIKDSWPDEMQESFDFVHQRFVMAGVAPGSPMQVIQNLAGLLKPGGWLQLIEVDTDPISENGPALQLFLRLIREMLGAVGLGNFAEDLKRQVEEAGLKHVQEQVLYTELGETIGDKSLKQKSIDSPCGAVSPMLAVLRSLPLQLPDQELDGFEERLRDELNQRGGHNRIIVVWGQK